MNLTAMRFKNYVWPHNPRTYRIQFQRRVAVHKVPFGRYAAQDLGMVQRVMTGEGEFFGPEAYTEFKKLASVFYQGGAGTLFHPVWQSSIAFFVELTLAQEPRADYVRYTFTFWEDYRGYQQAVFQKAVGRGGKKSALGVTAQVPSASVTEGNRIGEAGTDGDTVSCHTVAQGETLWGIAQKYGLTLGGLLTLNPQVLNPNSVPPGTRLRVG